MTTFKVPTITTARLRLIQAGKILHVRFSSSNDGADPIGLREEPSPITQC
jgi:hypothetical protein